MSFTNTYKFSEFTLDSAKRTLFRGTNEIKLRDKDFDLLLFLVENALRQCSHDEIITAVWNGTTVENNSVEKAIGNIRSILGDDVKQPRFIKTVRTKGYLFVGDVKEVKEPLPEKSLYSANLSKPRSNILKYGLGMRPVLLSLSAILLIGFFGLLLWKGKEVWARHDSNIIFADDFSGYEIDPNRWTVKGKNVRVERGIAKLIVEETDNWGRLESSFFSFDLNKPITVKSRLKVMYSQNLKDKVFFHGHFGFVIKDSRFNEEESFMTFLGVKYSNYDYESKFPDGNTKEQKAEGFFLVKGAGDPSSRPDYEIGKVGPRIKPVWDEWFEQKIVYEPFSGSMKYFINDELKQEFNVGKFSTDIQENKLRLDINPQGWWLYHSIEIDYVEIFQ